MGFRVSVIESKVGLQVKDQRLGITCYGVGFKKNIEEFNKGKGEKIVIKRNYNYYYSTVYGKVQRTTSRLRRLHDLRLHDFYDFRALRLLIDLETHFCTVNPVSRSITSREVV